MLMIIIKPKHWFATKSDKVNKNLFGILLLLIREIYLNLTVSGKRNKCHHRKKKQDKIE